MPKDSTKHAGRMDDDIARDILQSLRLDDDVPDERITIQVNRGKVTLRGNVDNSFQKAAAESDAKKD
jgi:osmotically-inducible protein OsmY